MSTLCHSARQLNARPERKRLRVSFTPFGEIATVNGSPSISISRRISLRSFVAILSYTPNPVRTFTPIGRESCGTSRAASFRPGREDVLGVPLAPMLLEAGVTDETGFHQHDMSGLKDALEVRRVFLHQREHVPQPL